METITSGSFGSVGKNNENIEETKKNMEQIKDNSVKINKDKQEKRVNKIKLFIYADGPMASTGFGTVNKNIVLRLLKTGKYEIHCLSINYYGDPHELQGIPGLYIYPMINDPFGRNRAYPLLNKIKPDILFTINDYDAVGHIPSILMQYKEQNKKKISWLFTFPVDGFPIYPEYVEFLKRFVDKPVVISKYGLDVIREADPMFEMDQVYHGVDTNVYKPLSKAEVKRRKEEFGNKFTVLMVGTNQLRKQYPIALEAFARFSHDKDDVMLLLHTQRSMAQGWDLDKLIRLFALQDKVYFINGLTGIRGVTCEELNLIYNVSDVYLTTSCGEGFSLTVPEAMAAGLPIIYHDCTSLTEVVGDAGLSIPTDHHTIFPNRDRELIRPIPSSNDTLDALNKVYNNKELLKELSAKSLNRIHKMVKNGEFNWDNIASYFDEQFEKLLKGEDEELDLEEIL